MSIDHRRELIDPKKVQAIVKANNEAFRMAEEYVRGMNLPNLKVLASDIEKTNAHLIQRFNGIEVDLNSMIKHRLQMAEVEEISAEREANPNYGAFS